jgi:N-acetylmuramoyl-L-alanine amidase
MKLATALLVIVIASEAQTPHSVTAVRHWVSGEATRVAIEVTGEFQYRSDRLANPSRIYFDILNSHPRLGSRLYAEDVDDRLLKRVRVAETIPGITRIVLELADNVDASPSVLLNPSRLVVELRLSGAPATPPVIPTTTPPVSKPPSILRPDPLPKPVQAVEATPPPVVAEPAKVQVAQELPAPLSPDAKIEAKVETVKAVGEVPAVASSIPTPVPRENAKSARHTSSGQNSLTRALGLKINRVVIDPGHGGHDQGTMGTKGLLEKDLVLDVSLRLGKLIEERLGAEVVYTRTDDTFVPLEGRTALANDKKADLFLSIHANSSPEPHVAGIETYYLNFSDSKDALDLAARENASSQKSVFELKDLIQQITLHDKAEESKEFARRVQTSLFAFSSSNITGEKNRGVRKAPFVVLIGANMPSVLAEIGFLSNLREETLLKKPDYRQKLAEALFRGVSRYAEGLSHFQVAQNQ